MAWEYLQLTDEAQRASSGSSGVTATPVFAMLDRIGVKPGTHQFLRVDRDAVYQGTALYQTLLDEGIATKISEGTFKSGENFRKRTINVEDLTGIEGAGPRM